MILGGCIALLMLSGGAPAAEPPDDAVPNTYYKQIIGWDEDPGGGGGGKAYKNCWIEPGIGPAQKSIVHWTGKSDGKTDKTFQMSHDAAVRRMSNIAIPLGNDPEGLGCAESGASRRGREAERKAQPYP